MRALLLFAVVIATLLSSRLLADEGSTLVIVVDASSTRSEISLDELRAIFLGKKHEWADGTRIVPLDLEPGTPEREAFNALALGMDQGEVDRYWVDQRVRGTGNAPRTAPTPASTVRLASKVKGVIAYVPQRSVDATVKVLRISGIAPGKPGYPLAEK